MNKRQTIEQVGIKTRMPQRTVRLVLNAFFDTVFESLLREENVNLAGFGSFLLVDRKSRIGRNPTNGERMEIPARTAIVFKPATRLMNEVNNGASI
ncbi:HU family DNA-binding protein [Parabacteroides sp. OttesenSCG-928-N08]|nr:HU family DNA-binding protein [Parabacteroides sp. OttesenSCG-928-N08]